jgi:4-amino-4-deoxychorismate lyase
VISAYRNGGRIEALPLDSRAAHYGDGAFTTMRAHAGRIAFWPAHRQRLVDAGCALHLTEPDWHAIEAMLSRVVAAQASCVLKLALVPQSGGRGYARPWPSACDVYLFVYAPPALDPSQYREGIALATVRADVGAGREDGVKTLSRLDQVRMAPLQASAEALVCDRDGFVLGGLSANLFALFGTVWATPPAARGTIAGVARSLLLASPPPGFSARVQTMHRDALDHAEAVFLCNAVRGVMPVRRIDARDLPRVTAVDTMMHLLNPELGLPEA